MTRIREGWWLMLAVCVGCGLWLLAMPLLGLGFQFGSTILRPAWLGVPPCLFGAVYAASHTRFPRLSAGALGVAVFVGSFAGGLHHQLQAASNWVPCHIMRSPASCENVTQDDKVARRLSPIEQLRQLRSPLELSTLVEATE